jgi:DNA-binding transcriptional LysR family regulator
MELSQIEAFVEVARNRSFSRAAQVLFVTQPTITSRIQSLERELGVQLFERRSRGVFPTDDGMAFLAHAERSLQSLNAGREVLKGLRSAKGGKLYIGAARTITTYVLPYVLKRFQEQHPDVELAIRTGRSNEIQDMLLEDQVHVGLTRHLVHAELESVHLYDEEMVLVTHPEHPFTSSESVTIYELGHEPLILYDLDSAYYTIINRVCQEAGIVPRVTMQLDSTEATKKMIEQGLGVYILPYHTVEREVEAGTLATVNISRASRMRVPTSVIYRHHRPLSGTVSAFLDVLSQMYGRDTKGRPQPASTSPSPA